jgi:hypothetical protein
MRKRKLHRFKIKEYISEHQKGFRLALVVLAVVLAAWLGFIWYRLDNSLVRTDPSASTNDDAAVKFVPSTLTGVSVSEDLAKRPTLSAQVENSPDARPQSGLINAGVIFEAIAEGGITRFNATWQEEGPKVVGPVRSLRPYYIDWALGFDAAILNSGASIQATNLMKQITVKDLNVGGAYYRDSTRFAPHNAYSTYDQVVDVMKRLGYYQTPKFTPIKRKAAAPRETPNANTINVDISSELFNLTYRYSADCNCYARSMAGSPHKDRESGKQLSPDVVVVLKAPHSVISSVGHMGIKIVGSGQGWIFQDGGVTKVTWKKTSRAGQITFTNSKKEAVALNPGQTWFTVIPTDKSVSYKK